MQPSASDPQIAELASICVAAAEAGARVLRDLYEKPREVLLKGRIDLVTDADRAAEERILALLEALAPGVAVLAEESGAHGEGSARVRFIVDPLDGTTNYAHGIPLFACTVAAELRGQAVAGCTIDPVRGERFRALRGGGAWLSQVNLAGPGHGGATPGAGTHGAQAGASGGPERRLAVGQATELSHALVCTGFPYDWRGRLGEMMAAFGAFTEQSRGTRRLGSAALDLAFVAAGRLDVFYERGLKPWDVAAGQVLVEEAGGIVSRFDGTPLTLAGEELLATSQALAPACLGILAQARGGAANQAGH